MVETFHNSVTLHIGDANNILDLLVSNSVDSCVCDPPYGISINGKDWDSADNIAFKQSFWEKVFRVLKPGGHLLAFSATRTDHHLVCAIEKAGFEIRDKIVWVYSQGMPHGTNIGKKIGAPWKGWDTALKPAHDVICMARKPLEETTVAANVLKHGTGGINIGECRITAGGIVDKDEVPDTGRFPSNVIHDGSESVIALFPESAGAQGNVSGKEPSQLGKNVFGKFKGRVAQAARTDSGSAARYFQDCHTVPDDFLFYCSKSTPKERGNSKHPTVKPVELMRYLTRLVTPPGGTVLDPFAGTGSTGHGALLEGFRSILIEREVEYCDDIRERFGRIVMERPMADDIFIF
jgi:site-specific DNA-methyltransferase (adenine-specific)